MELTQKSSRKRKQSSINTPFSGILTRQKSQKFFFNRNRSGKSRKCRSFQHPVTQFHTKINTHFDDVDDDDCHVSIKDLRARRVFSEPPEIDTVGKVDNPRFDSDLIDCKVDYFDGSNVENPNFKGLSNCDLRFNDGDSNLSALGKCDDLLANDLIAKCDDFDVENPNLLVDLEKCETLINSGNPNFEEGGFDGETPNFVALNKCDLGFDSGDSNLCMLGKCDGFDGEIPNLLLDLEKCETMIDTENPNLTVLKTCVSNDGGNPKLSVLKKCDLGVNDGNPSFLVLEKSDASRVCLVDGGLYAGELNKSIPVEKCDSLTEWEIPNVFEGGNGGMSNSSERFDGNYPDDLSPNLSNGFVKGGVDGNCEVVNEEIVQNTPPDAVVVIRNSEDRNVLKSTSYGKEMNLNKCSRRKVFKVPNSFTYKRLLPYLMDMAKDEPCTPKTNPSVKSDIDVEERLLGTFCQESAIDGPKSPENSLAIMAACVPQEVSIDGKDETSYDPKTVSPRCQTNLVSDESQILDDLKQGISEDDQISPDNLAVTLQSAKTSPEVSKKDVSLEPHSHFDMELKRGESSISPAKLDIVVSSSAPVTKGILKRNPLGCRGICSCLNCSSFRLNSEKAFEFSKNQLFEAEEVAHDLMNELSYLSSMLKKSIKGNTEVETISINQVEEACRRASNVQDRSRTRLSQMHEDLFVHSRVKALQRPRVNFSGNVQEIVTKQNDLLMSP